MSQPNIEEVREAISKRETKMFDYYKQVFFENFEQGYPIEWDKEIIDLVNQAYTSGFNTAKERAVEKIDKYWKFDNN